jgi:hypothetical protein
VESSAFLEELDLLAEEYPIDFYTESSPLLQDQDASQPPTENVLFQRFLRNTVKHCHMTELRHTKYYIKECPTSYLRWHYTDARTFTHAIEGYLYNPLLYVLDHIKDTFLKNRKKASKGTIEYIGIGAMRRERGLHTLFYDEGMYRMGKKFMVKQLELLGNFREENYTSEPVAKVICHVFDVFQHSQEFLRDPLGGDIPDHAMSRLLRAHLDSRAPHLALYWESIYHLIWSVFTATSEYRPKTFKAKQELDAFLLGVADVILATTSLIHQQVSNYFILLEQASKEVRSVIAKQYRKQGEHRVLLGGFSEWVVLYCKDLFRHPQYLSPFISLYSIQTFHPTEPLYPFLVELLSFHYRKPTAAPFPPVVPLRPGAPAFTDQGYGKALIFTMASLLYLAVVHLEKSSLDLYLLLRMLKTPGKGRYREEGVSGLLAITFLGHAHNQHLRDILVAEPFSYEERASVIHTGLGKGAATSRCITLPRPISLRKDLEGLVASMNQWPNQRERYQRRILEENRIRGKRRATKKANHAGNGTRRANRSMSAVNENNNSFYGS